jgi:SAM-dependent methyltransferase/uncharacterized protein YbaR (Trm112 family)
MKPCFADIARCPSDGGSVVLHVFESRPRVHSPADDALLQRSGLSKAGRDVEVMSGVLVNERLQIAYPILDGVPRLLRFAAGVVRTFGERFGDRLRRELPLVHLPNDEAMPAEEEVLRTFSSEWVGYDWDGASYWNMKADSWFRSMDYVLDIAPDSLRGKRVLEVGIGIGGVANHVATTQAAETVGMDLGHAVDVAFKHFGNSPLLHIVQASAFQLPYAALSFDYVYSFGVLHHTFSTKTAFDAVAKLPKESGKFFLWVYSPVNENRTLLRRTLMKVEKLARPVITRLPEKAQTVALLPTLPVYMAWQVMQTLRGEADVRYGFREALHAARDRLTPRFAHRHTEDEVAGWFSSNGFFVANRGSERTRPEWLPVGFLANTAITGVRATM